MSKSLELLDHIHPDFKHNRRDFKIILDQAYVFLTVILIRPYTFSFNFRTFPKVYIFGGLQIFPSRFGKYSGLMMIDFVNLRHVFLL